MIKDTNFITIQGWMINKLNLKGNDLMVFAIIYGFSQDDGSVFSGSLQYLADWCNSTKRGIQKNLDNLVALGYIVKVPKMVNNIRYVEYYANMEGIEQSSIGIEQSSTNKIENKDINTISKDIVQSTSEEKPKKKSLYEKCCDSIDEYTDNERLKNALVEYLKVRLAIKDKPIRGLPQWNALLTKLDTLQGDKVEIVLNATSGGWASFYEVSKGGYKKDFSNEHDSQGNLLVHSNKINREEMDSGQKF